MNLINATEHKRGFSALYLIITPLYYEAEIDLASNYILA